MEHTSPPMRLTRRTLLEIIKQAPYPQEVVDNPLDWAAVAVDFIKKRLSAQLVDGVQYHKVEDWYEMTLFDDQIESYEQYVVPSEHGLYDGVICDSDVERAFVAGLEQREDVRLYVKLPKDFKVPTPIGNYNPDWAIVMDDPEAEPGDNTPTLFLIAETKGGTDIAKLRFAHEQLKIKYGCRHFRKALGVPYEVATNVSQLPAQSLGLLLEKGCPA
jgi:type III restriction enzyme